MDVVLLALLLGVAGAALSVVGYSLGRHRRSVSARRVSPAQPVEALPQHLAVEIRTPFFSLSEGALFRMLEQALPPGYRAFPNVRLYDLFLIVAALPPQQAALASLRDEHIDFLIVALGSHQPVAGIELSGKNANHAEQSPRDQAKVLAFQSAGLLLLHLRAEEEYSQASLEALLWRHLGSAERELA